MTQTLELALGRRKFLGITLAGMAIPLLGGSARAAAPTPLRAMAGTAPLMGGGEAPVAIWGYEGRSPGPLLRVRQGDEVRVRLGNELSQGTSIHWHGLRVPNAMDGVVGLTQDAVAPGGTMDYVFTARDAGTYWYHSHNRSWEQVARGLYGVLVVDEAEPPRTGQDLLFVLDDWRIGDNGQIHEASFGNLGDWSHGGRLGNWATVNSRSTPVFKARRGERIRLRLLNAANARIFELGFPDHAPRIIALDGQPVPPMPAIAADLVIAPGQRVDLMLDMSGEPGKAYPVNALFRDGGVEIARFEYDKDAVAREQPLDAPMALPANPIPSALDMAGAVEVDLAMEGGAMGGLRQAMMDGRRQDIQSLAGAGKVWAMNGSVDMPEAPLARLAPGRTALLHLFNDNRWPHAMHLHGHHFKVVARHGAPVEGAPWRDTQLVEPGERVTFAFVGGAPGKWLFHCHMLEHHAAGMRTWIEVAA